MSGDQQINTSRTDKYLRNVGQIRRQSNQINSFIKSVCKQQRDIEELNKLNNSKHKLFEYTKKSINLRRTSNYHDWEAAQNEIANEQRYEQSKYLFLDYKLNNKIVLRQSPMKYVLDSLTKQYPRQMRYSEHQHSHAHIHGRQNTTTEITTFRQLDKSCVDLQKQNKYLRKQASNSVCRLRKQITETAAKAHMDLTSEFRQLIDNN